MWLLWWPFGSHRHRRALEWVNRCDYVKEFNVTVSRLVVSARDRSTCACHCQGKPPIMPGVFKYFSSWHRLSYPSCHAPTHGSLMAEFVPHSSLLCSFPSVFVWPKIVLDYSSIFSFYPVGSQFQLKRIRLLNAFLSGTKHQSRTPVRKKALIMQLWQLPYLASPLHSSPSTFSTCSTAHSPSSISSSVLFRFHQFV